MNLKTNAVLEKMRQTLKDELEGRNLQDANLNEAERAFVTEAHGFFTKAGYEVEGFEDADPEFMVGALKEFAEEEGGETAEAVEQFLSQYR